MVSEHTGGLVQHSIIVRRILALAVVAVTVASCAPPGSSDGTVAPSPTAPMSAERSKTMYQRMSSMGTLAAGLAPPAADDVVQSINARLRTPLPEISGGLDTEVNAIGGLGFQSETTIAGNTNASVLIAGYNDSTGFPSGTVTPGTTPLSLSGVARSTDGGTTWAAVPVGPGGASTLPCGANGELYGDPVVKYDPTRDIFVYASIYLRPGDGLEGMAINTSDSTGTTWSNPIAVTPSFITGHSADKEWIDINRTTGRILMAWTDFGTTTESILTSYSDDLGVTWSPAQTLQTGTATTGVQGASVGFLPAATNAASTVYVVWSNDSLSGGVVTNNIGCSRSTDGGATWSAMVNLDATSFPEEDLILGMDRVDSFPQLAVDSNSGRAYTVFQRGNSQGTGEVGLRTFVGQCASGAAVLLNSDPGNDRAQSHPFVTVDQSTHRVHVGWYDQNVDSTGDRLEVLSTYSDDQGTTWSPPTPLTDRPFHAGFGNDTSQPNLGDYNNCVAIGGSLYSLWGGTSLAPLFNEGEPGSASMITPDTYSDVTLDTQKIAPLRLAGTSVSDASFCASGGNNKPDPGETVDLTVSVTNYVANAVTSAATVTGISGTLTTTTPGVTILRPTAAYADAAPLGTVSGTFSFALASNFVPGTWIDFVLTLTTSSGTTQLPFRTSTGADGTATNLMSENWTTSTITASQTPPTTTAWYSVRGGTTSTARAAWGVNQNLTPGNNSAFHSETNAVGWIRLWSPYVTIPTPTGESNVTLDFDLVYNLHDEPTKAVEAYDGLTVRITDQTTGATLRSVLAEAFATQILTGSSLHFPKHLVRDNNTAYLDDMSVWSGNSNGPVHVSMRFPGAGMVGRTVQLRFEYMQEGNGICSTGTCGVAIDNIVMNVVPVLSAACTPATAMCGDGKLEVGEQCDDGAAATGCCSASCQFNPSTTVCATGAGGCMAALCNGAGACGALAPVANGTSCNDGNACTQTDTCQAGACTGSNPVTCSAMDQCHVAGTCNPATGVCSNPAAPNNTACNDGNACTQTDTCQAGACTGSNPVTCSASDQCHVVGTCDPLTGMCSNPAANDGSACNDGNACTRTDTCQAGTCTGSNPVVCTASDQCHVAGSCDSATGLCSNPAASDGTACSDGNACTTSDTCQAGTCQGGTALSCDDGNACTTDSCNPSSGCVHTGGACADMANVSMPDLAGAAADLGGGGGADLAGSGGSDLGGGDFDLATGGPGADMAHGGGGSSGCGCIIGGRSEHDSRGLVFASVVILLLAFRRRRSSAP